MILFIKLNLWINVHLFIINKIYIMNRDRNFVESTDNDT